MQLTNKPNLAKALLSASCTLLGGAMGVAHAEEDSWKIDTALMFYQETDRVQALEPVISATKSLENDKSISLKLTLDALTGASPNGATASSSVQTFTRPSGNGEYSAAPGEIPLDDTFKDTRAAFSVQWQQPLNRLTDLSVGGNLSSEYDYNSLGFNASLSRYFNKKNTTVTAGLAYSSDTISPEGNVPVPFASMLPAGRSPTRQSGDEDKTVTDLLLGLTQIINERSLLQINYSYSSSDGYLTDPFKLLTIVDPNSGNALDYVFENRPDTRLKQSIFIKGKYQFVAGQVLDISYRYLWDDWDTTSHTVDGRYRFNLGERSYLEPHLRYYTQSEADFYTHYLVGGAALPDVASADSRLGAFSGITYGAKVGFLLAKDSELSFRLEYYQQTGDTVSDTLNVKQNGELFPDLDAIIAQVSYSFTF